MNIVDFSAKSLLVPSLHATNRTGVYTELAQRLHQYGCIGEVDAFVREIHAPDGVFHMDGQHGVVFAWARGWFVKENRFALGKSASGIFFAPTPEALVHLVFLIAAPTTKGCVDVLTALTWLLSHETSRDQLIAASTPAEMYATLAIQTIATVNPPQKFLRQVRI